VIRYHSVGVFISTVWGLRGPGHLYPVTASSQMGDVVNLRAARKQAKRRQAEQKAAANRLAHGRSKQERTLEGAKNDKATRNLDHHRIETGDGP
jgi:Domain of unknown function (DUF4169)